ncbi:PDGLE domain-containing protein [Cohnella suwonensis]|uniref:PDGLE domain-containing protein n=1 Tax=Cohnella suwonensis TaxID=696072 RepID=A0ABW0LX28_9BACL
MKEKATSNRKKWIVVAAVTLIAAGAISYFASPHPDGLERVAINHGFIDEAKEPKRKAWLADYQFPGVSSPFVKGGLAGIVGAGLLFGALYLLKGLAKDEEDKGDGKGDHHAS